MSGFRPRSGTDVACHPTIRSLTTRRSAGTDGERLVVLAIPGHQLSSARIPTPLVRVRQEATHKLPGVSAQVASVSEIISTEGRRGSYPGVALYLSCAVSSKSPERACPSIPHLVRSASSSAPIVVGHRLRHSTWPRERTPLHHICTTSVGGRGSPTVSNGQVQRPRDLHSWQTDQVAAVGGSALIMLRSEVQVLLAPPPPPTRKFITCI